MNGEDDRALLMRYARERDERAFAALVRRHVNLVYSSAVRRVGDRHLAEDVTQAVFVILAKKAKSIRAPAALAAWLLRTVRYAGANALKIEARRRRHESAAAARSGLCSSDPSDVLVWQEIASHLDDAVLKLPSADRRAVLMRYFEDRPIGDIAAALHVSDAAAKQRLFRAIDKLRQRLDRQGAMLGMSAEGLARLLAAHAVQAAPAGLIHIACASTGIAGGAALTIAKGAMTMMTWTQTKLAASIVAAVMIVGAGGTIALKQANAADRPAAKRSAAATAPARGGALSFAPPVIVKTTPQAGDEQVDASLTELKVTFSKDMIDGNCSWAQRSDDTFPKTTGKPHYEADKRTCVLPVKLEADKTYVLLLNVPPFTSFVDTDHQHALPYWLVFRTKK